MGEVRLKACDVCGRHEGMPRVNIERVSIEIDGEKVRADICHDDLRPVRELIAKLPEETRRARQRKDFEALMVDDPADIPLDGG